MNILKPHKTDIPKKYVYIAALLFSLAVIIQAISVEQNPSAGLFFRRFVLFGSVYALWALCLDYINGLIKPFEKEKLVITQIANRLITLILLVIFNLIITNIIYYAILISFTEMTISGAYFDFQPYIFKSLVLRLSDVVIIGLILKIIDAYQSLQKQKLKVISLENQLHLSQLETLRNQLDPHFLFNTLHTLNTLIGYDDKKARSMLIKVTNLLRKILDKRGQQLITFNDELDYFKNYLEIEQERFHDRLEVMVHVEDNTRQIMVPTLMLQPLIENAFKHGIAKLEGAGKIKLNAFIANDCFTIILSNDIPKEHLSNTYTSTKIGLQNLDSRLKQVYGAHYWFNTKKEQGNFVATIKINYKN